jgi:hypothetical protein
VKASDNYVYSKERLVEVCVLRTAERHMQYFPLCAVAACSPLLCDSSAQHNGRKDGCVQLASVALTNPLGMAFAVLA